MPSSTSHHIIRTFDNGKWSEKRDTLTVEEPLEITVTCGNSSKTVAVTMRTPGHDTELAVGFLVSEGLVASESKAALGGESSAENQVTLTVDEKIFKKVEGSESLNRYTFVNSSCGICGRTSIEDLRSKGFRRVTSEYAVKPGLITGLPNIMRSAQEVFERTGGLHAAGLFSKDGKLLCVREDIGRHNAVDKVIGWAFSNGLFPLDNPILMVSGRLSYEIVQKALSVQIPIVCAVSAPSNLSVKVAHEFNITLIGFLRGNLFNIYANPDRIQ